MAFGLGFRVLGLSGFAILELSKGFGRVKASG